MEATNPIARALAQPHIVEAICSHLPMESLVSAALVNRDFFTFATDSRWSIGSLWALGHHVQLSRRQLYASKVRLLVMNHARIDKYRRAFRRVQFNGMRFLFLVRYSTPFEGGEEAAAYYRELHRYLSPQLTHLLLQQCRVTDAMLHAVENKCQNLRFLRLDLNWAHHTDEALAALLAANPFLEDIRFEPRDPLPTIRILGEDTFQDNMPKDGVIDATLLQCARQRKLRSLQLGPVVKVTPQLFQRICAQVPEPFPVLDRFMAAVPSMAASLLGQWCKNMHQLVLSIYDAEVPVLQGVSKMKNLRIIQIHFAPGTTFSSSDIMSLQSLSKLEILSFYSFHTPYPRFSLACDHLKEWIASFPDLKVLELQVDNEPDCHDNSSCVATLSRCCPRIERLAWPETIHFSKLNLEQSAMPLFPNLQRLKVDYATVSNDQESFPK
ncbi:hypothetical protein MY11210_004450 [Beauveria gryllotalpidicola]